MSHLKNSYLLIPFWGTLIFVVLYITATLYYPGGSQADSYSVGFSWANNYWCNLLNDTAMNGQSNPAKPIAMAEMLVLCLTLSFFWFLVPGQLNISKILKRIIQFSGTIAMMIGFFLFTNINHDLIINIASIPGLIVTIGVFVGLYKTKWYKLFMFGLCNILLVVLNNYFYYNKGLIIYLPVIQKISFAAFLTWICCINLSLYNHLNKTPLKA